MGTRLHGLLALCCAMVLCLCACGKTDPEPQQGVSVPLGTYTYTYEDGSTSQIVVEEKTFTIENGDYTSCPAFAAANHIFAASAEASKEGLRLSEEEKQRIAEEAGQFDFAAYDGVAVPYDLEQVDETDVNLNGETENGEPIWGLQLSYHGNDGTIGFGDGCYVLQQ
ncbi:hypothetical protein [Ruminococcus sp.]|uniref:hypothetical protein n=1 Tax=Ruminococcus sp. TaxID=41978 RepID=UPI003F11E0FF